MSSTTGGHVDLRVPVKCRGLPFKEMAKRSLGKPIRAHEQLRENDTWLAPAGEKTSSRQKLHWIWQFGLGCIFHRLLLKTRYGWSHCLSGNGNSKIPFSSHSPQTQGVRKDTESVPIWRFQSSSCSLVIFNLAALWSPWGDGTQRTTICSSNYLFDPNLTWWIFFHCQPLWLLASVQPGYAKVEFTVAVQSKFTIWPHTKTNHQRSLLQYIIFPSAVFVRHHESYTYNIII